METKIRETRTTYDILNTGSIVKIKVIKTEKENYIKIFTRDGLNKSHVIHIKNDKDFGLIFKINEDDLCE